mmetsp:Transcript_51441/g.146826  ORF Transcript_51441/g.146826 Transcript_51441/m.146826 type:complete len:286 (+) Transcript_51441:77-934(+)
MLRGIRRVAIVESAGAAVQQPLERGRVAERGGPQRHGSTQAHLREPALGLLQPPLQSLQAQLLLDRGLKRPPRNALPEPAFGRTHPRNLVLEAGGLLTLPVLVVGGSVGGQGADVVLLLMRLLSLLAWWVASNGASEDDAKGPCLAGRGFRGVLENLPAQGQAEQRRHASQLEALLLPQRPDPRHGSQDVAYCLQVPARPKRACAQGLQRPVPGGFLPAPPLRRPGVVLPGHVRKLKVLKRTHGLRVAFGLPQQRLLAKGQALACAQHERAEALFFGSLADAIER